MENKLTNEQIREMAATCVDAFIRNGVYVETADGKYRLYAPYVWDEKIEWNSKDDIINDMLTQDTMKNDVEYNVRSFGYANEVYRAMNEAEERAYDVYRMVFTSVDPEMVFTCGPDEHSIYYFNPDSVAGGQIVHCPFDDDMAQRILDGEEWINVVAEVPQYLSDIDTIHFFDTIDTLIRACENGECVGYTHSEEDMRKVMAKILKKS